MDVSDKLRYGEDNVIAVKADTGKPENSRWYTGGGLYRDVDVVITDPGLYFTRHPLYITTPMAEMDTATVNIQAEVANMAFDTDSLHIRTVIRSPGGKIVHDSTRAHCFNRRQKIKEYQADSLVIVNPARWDCDNPNLYTAELTLYRPDGSVADQAVSRFGIRKLEYSPESGD